MEQAKIIMRILLLRFRMTLVEYESDLQLLLKTAAILPHVEHLLCSHDDLVMNSSTSTYAIYIVMQNDSDLAAWDALAEVSCCCLLITT